MTDPKGVSDFAKEYQETYIALAQCKSAYEIVKRQLSQANDRLEIVFQEKEDLKERLKKYEDWD